MKRLLCIILTSIFLLSFTACSSQEPIEINDESLYPSSTAIERLEEPLILEGIPLLTKHVERLDGYSFDSEYVLLPLCEVLEGVGFEMTWESEDVVYFYCNGSKMVLNLSQKTLIQDGAGNLTNCLMCPPGNETYFCDVVDGVLMVDDSTVACLLYGLLPYPVSISYDAEAETVTIFERTE